MSLASRYNTGAVLSTITVTMNRVGTARRLGGGAFRQWWGSNAHLLLRLVRLFGQLLLGILAKAPAAVGAVSHFTEDFFDFFFDVPS